MLIRRLVKEGDDSFGGGHGADVPRKGGERGGLRAAVLSKNKLLLYEEEHHCRW